MSSFLFKFEAIESRIASYSCPRGIPGRVHKLRLRRCFQNNERRQSVAAGERLPRLEREGPAEKDLFGQQEHSDTRDVVGAVGTNGSKIGGQSSSPHQQRRRGVEWGFIRRNRLKEYVSNTPVSQILENMIQHPATQSTASGEVMPNLDSALRTGDPHTVLRVLLHHAGQVGFQKTTDHLVSMPAARFSEILRLMDSRHFVGRYQELMRTVSPGLARKLETSIPFNEDGYYRLCTILLSCTWRILEARQFVSPPTLSDYKYLLKCARVTGHSKKATEIWKNLMERGSGAHAFVPDVDCYNIYLSIKCWHDSMNPLLRYRLRVIEDNFEPRAWQSPPYSLKGHSVGHDVGIKVEVSRLFSQMIGAGLAGNEETFSLLMIALARDGDMPGVASILQRVWGVDVQALMTTDESDVQPAKRYSSDSPFYPTATLLFALAHGYGINNQIPTALRLVDFISSQYSIPIPTNVWNELLTWTFVLSIKPAVRKRDGFRVETGKEVGQLPAEAVTSLWNTMISEPYNVKPTIEMYNYLIANLARRQRFGEMQQRMEEGRRLLKKDVHRLSHKIFIFNATNRRDYPTHLAEQRVRDLVLARLHVQRNRQYVRRWVRLLIRHGSRSLKYSDDWSSQNLPNILKAWSIFLPWKVWYPIRSGKVSFWTGSRELNRARTLRRRRKSERWEMMRLRKLKGLLFSRRRKGSVKPEVERVPEYAPEVGIGDEFGQD